ncbi:enoyl-CoA hydratase/isomerase family protein [Thiotrichales bacterium 19S11-10]|nr:enoyl-CoA hydratase/isomerase family protein [Thiotrichales bacterium 19S11-10]
MTSPLTILEKNNHCYCLTLNRKDHHNALNDQMFDAIYKDIFKVSEDTKAKLLIIESSSNHFMVGGDIYYFSGLLQKKENERKALISPLLDKAQSIIEMIMTMPIPVIVITKGISAGYGLSLALASDYVIALEGSNYHSAYIGIGLTPDGGQLYSLAKAIGLKRAKQMLLFNQPVNTKKALEYGLVDQVCNEISLNETLDQFINKSKYLPMNAFGLIKRHVNEIETFKLILEKEKKLFLTQVASEEFALSIKGFIEREKHKNK